jgi:hypothetical protein
VPKADSRRVSGLPDRSSLSLPARRIPDVYEQRWFSELLYGKESRPWRFVGDGMRVVSRDSASATNHQPPVVDAANLVVGLRRERIP